MGEELRLEPRILVMAKAPVPGAVKTRLRLDPHGAARLQEALIPDTIEKARAIGPVTVAVSPATELENVRRLVLPGVSFVPQPEGDLGTRMLAGALGLFEKEGSPVIILGTDAPTLPPGYIREAARSLSESGEHDAALTPSEDGGYVLIGLRRPHAALFTGVPWSTPEVHRRTLDNARRAGLSVYETAPWHDVDEPDDLERLRAELSRDASLAPRTARLLAAQRA